MGVVVDLMTRLPVEIWFQENPRASDTKLESNLLNLVKANTLLLLDRGFYHFYFWQQLIDQGIENQDLGIVKQRRKPNVKLIVAPFPDRQRSRSEFFFQPSSETPLTIVIQA